MGPQPFPGLVQQAPQYGAGMHQNMPRPPAALPGPPGQHMFPRPGIPWGHPPPGLGSAPFMFREQNNAASWTTHMSPTGAPYYYNHVTRDSTWVRPACLPDTQPQPAQASPQQSAVMIAEQVTGTHWKRVICMDGRVYFSNASTNTTVWTPPPEIAHLVPPVRPFDQQPGMSMPLRPVPPSGARPMPRPGGPPPPLAQPPRLYARPPAAQDALPQPPADPPHFPQQMGNAEGTMHLGQGMAAAPHPPANGYGGGAWPAWQMPGAPPWQPGSNPTADMTADAEAEAAKEAAETAKHEFFQMLVEHRITAFSRWESSKKFEGDARLQAIAAKERKALFNAFCANVVEEKRKMEEKAQATATRGLQELLTELLGVTPMQFRLFREGKELAEVEAEVVIEEAARGARLKQFVGEEPEDGEQGDDGQEKHGGGEDSEDVLAVAALNADLDMVCGGLFTAGMGPSDVGALVPGDKRWTSADAELREQVFIDVLGPVLEERAAQDAAVVKRFEKRMHAWLGTQEIPGDGASPDAAWEALAPQRPQLLALLPNGCCLQMLKRYMESSRKSQKQRDAGARASAASASVTKRKREAEQHAEQRQQDAAKHTDEEAFRTLLFETVKDPSNATWGAVQEKLRKDHGQRMTSPLIKKAEYEGLFLEHVAALLAAARKQYTAALEECVRPALVGPDGSVKPAEERGQVALDWRAASEVLSTHPCFQKLASNERKARWEAFVGGSDEVHRHSSHHNNWHSHQNRDREQQKPAEAKRSRRRSP